MGAKLLNFTLSCWCVGVISSTAAAAAISSTAAAAAISSTAAAAAISSTAAGYILIGCIFVFGRALALFAFFIFGGHRSYF